MLTSSDSRYVVAVDPGKKTGIAWAATDGGATPPQTAALDWFDAMMWVHQNINRIDTIVCESYVITQATLRKSRGENWSLEQIGILRYLSRVYVVPFFLQTPSEGKAFATDAKLKHLGWWQIDPEGHMLDASRHLLLHLVHVNAICPTAFREML